MTVSKSATKKRAAKRTAIRKPATSKPSAKKAAPIRARGAVVKAIQPRSALAQVIRGSSTPRAEVTKKIWAYIKKNQLQASENKRLILPATVEPRYLTKAQILSMVKSVRKP